MSVPSSTAPLDALTPQPAPQDIFASSPGQWWEGGRRVEIGPAVQPPRLSAPTERRLTRRRLGGRRSQVRTQRKRGRYIRARKPQGKVTDLALDATLRAAAPYQPCRRARHPNGPALVLEPQDLHEKVRVQRAANLILFVVDASWSMAVAERMEATKGAIFALLTDAYQRRDRVGLITFQKDRALLVLPPTRSVELAHKVLRNIPVGGKTPLSAGLLLAYEVVKRERLVHPEINPLLVILTDGAANVAMGLGSPLEEAYRIARQIASEGIRSVVINMEHPDFDQGMAQRLAEHLRAACLSLPELQAQTLYRTVRRALAGAPAPASG